MPNTDLSEILLIAILMSLLIIISIVSIYLFIRQYKKEMSEKEKYTNKKKKVDDETNVGK